MIPDGIDDLVTTVPEDAVDLPTCICPEHECELVESSTSLSCEHGHAFAVRHGIPRFVGQSTYADAFGAQWNRYRRTQLDSYTGLPISSARLQRCLGEDLWGGLDGKRVLECGCGAGRFTEILLERGATVTSVDLSDAVEANQLNCPQGPRHAIVQADIMALPFPAQAFELVLCLGVVQHTPRPEATISALYDQVAPGGALVIDHYTHSLSRFTRLGQLPRYGLRHVSAAQGIKVTERLVDLLLPFHKRFSWASPVITRLSPVNSYYHAFPQLSDDVQREWALLDTHDHLTDYYKRLRTPGSIYRTLVRMGGADIWCTRGGNGVEARCHRPAGSLASRATETMA